MAAKDDLKRELNKGHQDFLNECENKKPEETFKQMLERVKNIPVCNIDSINNALMEDTKAYLALHKRGDSSTPRD